MALFTSSSVTVTLRNPIDDSALITLTTQLRNLDTGESPEYHERGYHRSGSRSSAKKRSKGQISLAKTPDGMALVRELERWMMGVTYYPLTSDLKGRTYRHPNLEISLTDSGTTEIITAYGVRLASRSFGLPLSGPASDSITLDVLRGFDLSATDAAEVYEPKRALDFHRTGSKTYINTAGTLSTATDGQAAIGVPSGTYSASKAGLVLEGSGTNLCLQSADLTAAPWATTGSGLTITANAGTAPDGTNTASRFQTTLNTAGSRYQSATVTNGATYTFSLLAKANSGTQGIRIHIFSGDGITQLAVTEVLTLGSTWQLVTATAAATSTSMQVRISSTSDGHANDVLVWGYQLEAGPFATSRIPTTTAAVTRNADLCGIVRPHNLLRYSEQFDNALWTLGVSAQAVVANTTAAPDGSTTADTLQFNAASSAAQYSSSQVTGAASKTYTFSVWVKAGTSTSLRLGIDDGTSTLAYADFTLTSSWQRVSVTGTAGSSVSYVRGYLRGLSTTGTFYAWGAQLVEGSHPGVYVRTTDTAIAAPASPALDPAWVQNGKLTGYYVQPSGANVAAGTVILGYSGGLLITQYASTITLSRVTAGGTRSVSITLNGADNTRHSFVASWGNYVTSAGVRSMPLTLTVDSTTATIDAAALYGDSSWSSLDASRLVSGGTVFATHSDLTPDWPTLPAGAIPA